MSSPSNERLLFLGSDTDSEVDDSELNTVNLDAELDLTDGEVEEPTAHDNEFIDDDLMIVDEVHQREVVPRPKKRVFPQLYSEKVPTPELTLTS